MKKLLPLIALLLPLLVTGQIDTEFWFAPPDLTQGTGQEPRRDSTVYIVVSTLNEPAEVRISQPANLSFAPITVNLAPNSSQAVNLGLFLSQLETKPANEVLNTGVLVRSTAPITAYYEIRSNANREILSFKGRNALGTKFYTPYEDAFGNSQFFNSLPYLPPTRAGFVVIASEDSTTVFVTPRLDVLGHPANETFEVFLMRGQTYYVEALNGDLENKPYGTKIESDKPIAVTLKDDMITQDLSTTSGADVAADQMFAYEWAGTDHIVVKGALSGSPTDRVVVLSTVDGTEITVDGTPVPGTFDEGEQYVYDVDGPSSYIETTEKVYVFHVTGQSDQLAGALIPPLNCTGSTQVGFVRPTLGAYFALNLTIKSGSEDNFTLNGDPSLIPASAFSTVPGSGGEWVFAKIVYNNSQIPTGSANLIENDGDEPFHLGVLTATSGNSANFGYFSNFSYLNIGELSEVCLNDSLVLDAGPGKTAYAWSTGDTTQTITVTSPGTYYVDAFTGTTCAASDTIVVTYYEPPISLGANDTICDGTTLTLNIEGNYLFEWSDGTTGPTAEISEEGWVWVEVTDFQECTLRDSVFISVRPRPETPEISGDDTYCAGETLDLSLSDSPDASYRFVRPDGTLSFNQSLTIEGLTLDDAGTYLGFIVVEGCESFNDSLDVSVIPSPVIALPEDQEICDGETFVIEATVDDPSADLTWQDGTTGNTLEVTTTGTYILEALNEAGCLGTDSVFVLVNPVPEAPVVSGNEPICEGDVLTLSTQGEPDTEYSWLNNAGVSIGNGSPLELNGLSEADSGPYFVLATIGDCDAGPTSFEITVSANPVVSLPADTLICDGEEIILSVDGEFASYLWNDGSQDAVIVVGDGTWEVVVTNEAGCEGSDEIVVTEGGPSAAFNFSPASPVEPQSLVQFTDLSDPENGVITSWLWQFGDGATSTQQNPSHAYVTSGTYPVSLTVTDANGCSSTVSLDVIAAFELRIPEGFSPNGDGVNDQFLIQGLEAYPGSTLQIFNRWGSVVFETNNYNNNWDGKDAVDGTYFYVLKLPNGEDFAGPITIAR